VAYRNKTYVCFDGDTDMSYYRLMQAWHQNDRSEFGFFNAHDINSARDTSSEESIKRQLRQRLLNTKVFVVLIGANTRYLVKFVRWEMEQALSLGLPVIGVNLNGNRQQDPDRCPPIIRYELALHISYGPKILQYALENWPASHEKLRNEGKKGPFHYPSSVYTQMGA
jgi:hypothetical protein